MLFRFGKKKGQTLFALVNDQLICRGDHNLPIEQQLDNTLEVLAVVKNCLAQVQAKYNVLDEEEFEFNDLVYVVGNFKVHPTRIDFACSVQAEGQVKYYLQELGFWRKLILRLFRSSLWYEHRAGIAGQDFFRTEIEAKVYRELMKLQRKLQNHRVSLDSKYLTLKIQQALAEALAKARS